MIPNELPPFISAEEIFPHWLMARPFIDGCYSTSAFFNDYSRVEIDYSWARQLLTLTPKEDIDHLQERLLLASELFFATMPAGMFDEFLRRPINNTTLNMINAVLADYEERRTFEGLPSLTDLIRHVLGISPILMNIKATISLDDELAP